MYTYVYAYGNNHYVVDDGGSGSTQVELGVLSFISQSVLLHGKERSGKDSRPPQLNINRTGQPNCVITAWKYY